MDARLRPADRMPLAASRSKAPVKSRIPVMSIVSDKPEQGSATEKDKLSLNGKQITSIEKIILGFTRVCDVQILELSMNLITAIPDCLASLRCLKHLDLSQNLIQSFGSSLSKIKSLVRLNLAKNRISRIGSTDIYQLFFAKTVIVSHNLIDEVTPNIKHLSNLRVLYLDGNPFCSLPISLKELKNLKELRLDWPEYMSPPRLPSITCQDFIQNNSNQIGKPSEQVNRWISWEEFCSFLTEMEVVGHNITFSPNDLATHFSSSKLCNTYDVLSRAIRLHHQGIALHCMMEKADQPFDSEKLAALLVGALKLPSKTVAERLLEQGAPCNLRLNHQQETVLHMAADSLSENLIRTLAKCGCDPNLTDDQGNTALHKLFQKKNDRESYLMKSYCSNQFNKDNSVDYFGQKQGQEPSPGLYIPDNLFKGNSLARLNDQYHIEFQKKLAELAVQLIDMGVDPNVYNGAGLCAWHLLVIKESYVAFKLLRLCDVKAPVAIDWSLGAFKGEIPALHLAAMRADWRFFLEFLEGACKVNSIQFDYHLRLPLEVLGQEKRALRSKIYLKHLIYDYSIFLRFQNSREDVHKTRLKRKASLLKRNQGEDTTISQKSKCSNDSSGFKKLIPTLQISKQITKFSPYQTDFFINKGQQSVNTVFSMKPKSGFLKFSTPQSTEKLESNNITLEPESNHQNNQRSVKVAGLSKVEQTSTNHRGTNLMLAGIALNLKAKPRSLRTATDSNQMRGLLLNQYPSTRPQVHQPDAKSLRVMIEQNFSVKQPSRIHTTQPSDLSENAHVNKSRRIEVSANMSQLNSMRSLQSMQRVEGQDIALRFIKIFTKALLKDLISFRYSLPKLELRETSEIHANNPQLVETLHGLRVFFAKVDLLMAAMSSFLKPEMVAPFTQAVAFELMHDDCLLNIRNSLERLIDDQKPSLLRSKRYIEIALIEEILERISNKFGRDLVSSSPGEFSGKAGERPAADRKQMKPLMGKNEILKKALIFTPEKQVKHRGMKLIRHERASDTNQLRETSLESSGESLNLDINRVLATAPMGFKANMTDLAEKLRLSTHQTHQMPMNRFISDHDKGLKSLENKIISFRNNFKTTNQDAFTPIIGVDHSHEGHFPQDGNQTQPTQFFGPRRLHTRLL
jgi:hypothetical protein